MIIWVMIEWIEVKIPLEKFEATLFGRVVHDAGPVERKQVNAVGFMAGLTHYEITSKTRASVAQTCRN